MLEIWKEGGALARSIEGYEYRPQQEEFASLVQETIEGGGVLLVEAPTGVGKSLAYLVPAIDWAMTEGGRVVVSTNTKNLQDQLYSKDIPKVAAALDRRLYATVIKGRSNYVCLRRWNLMGTGQVELTPTARREEGLATLGAWIGSTDTGDLAEFEAGGDADLSRLAEAVRVEEGLCDPGRCGVGDECFLRRLRRRASGSQILCVNHAMLVGQLLGCWDIIPSFDVLIIDESHNMHKVAADRLSIRFGAGALNRAVSRLAGKTAAMGRAKRGKARGPGASGAGLGEAAKHAGDRAESFFGGLRRILLSKGESGTVRYGKNGGPSEAVMELGAPLHESCCAVGERLRDAIAAGGGSAEALEEMEAELALWTEMEENLEHLLNPAEGDGVFWIDPSPALRWAPIDVAGRLGPALDGACHATVLTSATLAVKGDFEYFKSSIGLTRENSSYPRCVSLGSPFDVERSVLFMVPEDAPDPRDGSYTEYVANAVARLLESTRRKALVLFTSHSMLRDVRAILSENLPGNRIFAQGVDGERTEITRAFKKSRQGALLGTASFWEGVDFPGEEVELLIIARLPFPVPSDPVIEGRSEWLMEQGKAPFFDYHLPEAVMKLRQGFGRLIRTSTDRGVVVVLDPRIVRASYFKTFLKSLPVGPKVLGDIDAVACAAADWFQGVQNDA